MDAFWIILTGILVAVPCSLLGSFLVLRKMAMVGDAISHAVLPGIVIAFLISGQRDSITMTLGASIIGLLTTFFIEFFHQKAKLQSDAAIGITFTWLFALGVILISLFTGNVDLDQECVLYGEIAYVPLDLWILKSGFIMGPRVPISLLLVTFLIFLFIISFYKELKITTFDPGFALASGLSVSLWNYLLMGAVSFTTVASFEAVGAILVVAFLVVPASTALLLSKKLSEVLVLSVVIGALSVFAGYFVASWLNSSIAASMAVCTGLFFLFAIFYSKNNSKKSTNRVINETK
jgi:manganese/zinc/iron transport system permease protein